MLRFPLKTERIIIRPLRKNDLDKRLRWKSYPDPLYQHYNLSVMSEEEKAAWYSKRKTDPNLLYLAIDNHQGELLGFINIFNIDPVSRHATFGIYLGYEFTDKGNGTEAVKTILPYCFEKMQLTELRLHVAALNHRAIRCYRKSGSKWWGQPMKNTTPVAILIFLVTKDLPISDNISSRRIPTYW